VHPQPLGADVKVRDAARMWGVSKSTAARRLAAGRLPNTATASANI
jgi:hypothetical protein